MIAGWSGRMDTWRCACAGSPCRRCSVVVRKSTLFADRDGVDGLEEAQTQFADFLKEFCGGPDGGGTDEESMLLGALLPWNANNAWQRA